MKKVNLFLTSVAASAVVLGTLGCGKSENKAPEIDVSADEIAVLVEPDIPIDETPLYDLYQKVDALLMGGDTNAANEAFVTALDDSSLEPFKSPLFNTMIRYFIFTDQIEAAKEQYLNALRTLPEIAEPGFDTIYGAYMSKGDLAGALAWARVLATQDINPDLRMTATDWLIGSLFRNEQFDEMGEEVSKALENFEANRFAPLLARIGQEAIGVGNITVAEKLLGLIDASEKRDEIPYFEMRTTMQIRIDSEKGDWEKIATRMPILLTDVADQPLQQAIGHAFQSARRASRFDMIEKLASAIVHSEQAAERDRTRSLAAREWIRILFDGDEPDLPSFPTRIDALMKMGLPPRQVYSIYSRHFYDLINDVEVIKACIPLVDQLLPLLADEASQNGLRSYQLDACFLVDDFDRALEILEKGLPERDADWHEMAIVKVKAHKAQQEGRFEDAVGLYRQFMGTIKEEDIADPGSDLTYSQATLMGKNEQRIGDIYGDAGKPDEAAQAYVAARKWYDQALESNKAGEATEAYIRAQIAALPGVSTVVEEPVAEEPVAEEPAAEEPVAEEPAAEESAIEEPAAEEPAIEEPVVEVVDEVEPTVVEPAVETPAS